MNNKNAFNHDKNEKMMESRTQLIVMPQTGAVIKLTLGKGANFRGPLPPPTLLDSSADQDQYSFHGPGPE